MTGRVAVVTDSTAYLPDGLAEQAGLTIVPLQVRLGLAYGAEGIDVSPADVTAADARRGTAPTTSRPAPAEFARAYDAVLRGGAGAVVSVHLSADLSGTVDSARAAAKECGGPDVVRVVDSRSTAMGLGFPALAAARAAAGGGDLAAVTAAAERSAARTTTLFYVDTLEHLRRGGRIGAAKALFGTALSVKPILRVTDGQIVPLERVRTPSRGIARLAALAAEAAGEEQVDLAVHHLAAPDRAQALVDALRAGPIHIGDLHVCEVGAVIGAHVGPGLGVVISRR